MGGKKISLFTKINDGTSQKILIKSKKIDFLKYKQLYSIERAGGLDV